MAATLSKKASPVLLALILGSLAAYFILASAPAGRCAGLAATVKSYNETIDDTPYLTAEVLLDGQKVLSFHSTGDQPEAAARAEQVAKNLNILLAKNADWDNVTAGWDGDQYRVTLDGQEVFTLIIPDSYFQHTKCKDLAVEWLDNIKKVVAASPAVAAPAASAQKPEFPSGAIMAWLGGWIAKNGLLIAGGTLGLAVLIAAGVFLTYLRRQSRLIRELTLAVDQLERRIPQMTAQARPLPALNPEEHRLTRYHQVLQLLKEGLSPVEISQKSGIGKGEIELICSLYEKQKNLPPGQKQTIH